MEEVDLLVKEAFHPYLQKTVDIAVKEGRIYKIAEKLDLQAKEVILAKGKVVFPSFANMHTHVSMSLLRSLGADLPLMDWLQKVIWPLEGEFVSPEFVRAGAKLGILEMIKSGTTLFMDMYFYEEEVGEVAIESGVRAGLGVGILDFPTKVASGPDGYIERAKSLLENFKGNDKVFVVLCPHAPYTCSPETLRKVLDLSEETGAYIHIHVAETKGEVEKIKEEYGKTPVKHLNDLGLLSEKTLCAHMVWVDEEETQILRETSAVVVHCPESNLKLASGIAPIPRYIKEGVKVCLGTDGPASNDNLDMLEETSTMAKLHKGNTLDAKAIDARTALKIATEEGFKAVGIKGGRVEEGFEADFILVDFDKPHLQPMYDPVAQLVYSAKSSDIDTVVCKGKVLMEKREVKTLDEEKILKEAGEWRDKIWKALQRL